ncbi:VP1/VP3 family protein [Sulfurisphaera ohwakuensis]|uniref:VP1/VP3 family protein n=1 Tax=Sulfurisphaera ohwakuensis TaxID=69656 RepID=UPI0036F1D794
MSLVSSLVSKVKEGIDKAKVVYYVIHIDKYFSEEQIAEAVRIFYQTWDGNIVSSARKFAEVAKADPKLTRGEGNVNVGLLIALFIFILIGIVLLPVITSEVNNLTSGTSPQVTGTNATLLNLVPLFYILVIIIVPAVIVYKMMEK